MWRTDSLWFETAIVLGIFAVGNILFGHFEQHRHPLRRLAKVVLVLGLTLTLSATLGRIWGLGWLLLPLGAAAYVQLHWLPKNGVNGLIRCSCSAASKRSCEGGSSTRFGIREWPVRIG